MTMRQELDEQLYREFPNLYRQRGMSMRDACMCWGFSCGDGWFDIIYELSKKLEALILKLPEEEREHCRAAEVKEKFGCLRFYLDGATDEMWELIGKAESESVKTCEKCGSKEEVKPRGPGWIMTECKECYTDRLVTRVVKSRLDLLIHHGIGLTQQEWDERKEKL